MTTSGEISYNPVRDIIIKKALRLVGAYSTGNKPRGDQIDDASEALNMMIKAWQIQGFMWLKEYATLFLEAGKNFYSLPGAKGATEYVQTTLLADIIGGDSIIPVADSTNMLPGDEFAILLDDGNLYWDVILTVDSPVQITLTGVVGGDAVLGAIVYSYNPLKSIYRPTRVFSVSKKYPSGSEISLNSMGRDDYSSQVSKNTQGTPTQYYYDPQISSGILYIWQPPMDGKDTLILDIDRPLQIMLDSANTSDFPEEWVETLAYGLAIRIAPEYAVPLPERRELKSEFSGMVSNLMAYNIEWTSTFLGVDYHG